MSALFERVVAVIEQEYFNETFLERQWPEIKRLYAVQDAQANSVQERETIITQMPGALERISIMN